MRIVADTNVYISALMFGGLPDVFLKQAFQGAFVVRPTMTLDIVKDDPDDNRVLECAAAGDADYVVSGDRHLLKLRSFDSVPILTVRQFMDTTETGGA